MDIKVYPDTSGAAPEWATFYAIDADSYDGAPDSPTRNYVGHGATELEAAADLIEKIAERAP